MPTAATTSSSSSERVTAASPCSLLVRVWVGVLLSPAAWIADLLSRYMLIRFVNVHSQRWPLHVCTVISAILLSLGATLCWRAGVRPRAGSAAQHHDAASPESVVALARWGLALAAFFLLLIVAQAFPAFVLNVQEIT
jgi:hypothetical protein